MRIAIYDDTSRRWLNNFNAALPSGVEPIVFFDDALRHDSGFDLLILPPGRVPIRAATATLLLAGGDAALHISSQSRITYGMSDSDSITVSSILERDMILTLQHDITALDGSVIEPQEWRVVRHTNWSVDQTLAFETVKLLAAGVAGGVVAL